MDKRVDQSSLSWTIDGEPPKMVLLWPYMIFHWAFQSIMPVLRQRYQTRFVLAVPNAELGQQYSRFLSEDDVVVIIPSLDELQNTQQSSTNDTFQIARQNEKKFGINYTRDIVQLDRLLSTNWFGIAPNSHFGNLEPPPLEVVVESINNCFSWMDLLFDKYEFDLFLGWPISLQDACCTYIAQHRGILVTYPYVSKLDDLTYWASGPFTTDFQHREAFERLESFEAYDPTFMHAPAVPVHLARKTNTSELYATRRIMLDILRTTYEHLSHILIDIRKGRSFWPSRITSWRRTMFMILNSWSFYKKFSRLCIDDLDEISRRPFVFYAFHQEPEYTVQAQAKDFNDQGAIVRQIAKSLPAGVNLVIKEHATLGFRPLRYYQDLARFPNVVLAHPDIPGHKLVEKSLAAVSLRGTVTLEAALWGKPALVFVPDTEFSILSNTRTVSSLAELVDCLKDIAEPLPPDTQEKYREDGARFREAIREISFPGTSMFSKDGSLLTEQDAGRAVDLLVRLNNLFHRDSDTSDEI